MYILYIKVTCLSVYLTGRAGQGEHTFLVIGHYLLAAPIRNRAGQGGHTFLVIGRYFLAAPIRNRAGQGREGQLFSL